MRVRVRHCTALCVAVCVAPGRWPGMAAQPHNARLAAHPAAPSPSYPPDPACLLSHPPTPHPTLPPAARRLPLVRSLSHHLMGSYIASLTAVWRMALRGKHIDGAVRALLYHRRCGQGLGLRRGGAGRGGAGQHA